ncbi:MAG: NmrA/HSCARG family protein [Actinomycetia bacterium]|nr:NmrA/HSCARG family protein [Actinomycetes bacterium]
MVLVIGATGNQGGSVVRALLAAGVGVRALTRRPAGRRAQRLRRLGVEVVGGDLGDPDRLTRALEGAVAVFAVQNYWETGPERELRYARSVLQASRRAEVRHLIYSSGLGVRAHSGLVALEGKFQAEQELRASGIPYTVIRPALFMEDFLGASVPLPTFARYLLSRSPIAVGRLLIGVLAAMGPPSRRVPLCALSDVGQTVSWALDHPAESLNRAFDLVGDAPTVRDLQTSWQDVGLPPAWSFPGISLGLRLLRPDLAALLHDLTTTAEAEWHLPPLQLTRWQDFLQGMAHPAH